MRDELDALKVKLEAMQALLPTDEERDAVRFLIRVVGAIQGTAWLGSWVIKIAPVIAALYFFGERGVHWFGEWMK